MKSAEDWALSTYWLQNQDRIEIVKQIQLDAIKHGMTEAAEIIKTELTEMDACNDQDYAAIAERRTCTREILSARDSKASL